MAKPADCGVSAVASRAFLGPAAAAAWVLVLLLATPTALTAEGEPEREGEILVAAASDLRFAFDEMAEAFEAEYGQSITFSFGSSGRLTQQIENGAPFDLFFSANRDYIDGLAEGGFASGEPVVYASGYLALVVPEGEPLPELDELDDERFEAISIANPSHAPYGLAAQQALESLGVYADVEDRLVYGDNVLDAMRLVESANADVGLVALAFLDPGEGIEGRRVDDSLHDPIEQTALVLDRGGRGEDGEARTGKAEAFLEFVRSEQGQEIMRSYRFGLP